jgi:hypothetical protein
MDNKNEWDKKQRSSLKSRILLVIVALTLIGIIATIAVIISKEQEYTSATKAFKDKVQISEKCNKNLQYAIDEGKRLYDSNPEVDSILPLQYLGQTIEKAKSQLVDIPALPQNIEDINEASSSLFCADDDGRYSNAIMTAYNQVLQSQQAKSRNDKSDEQTKALKNAVKQPEYQAPTYTPPAQECKQEKWLDSNGIEFTGCASPLEADREQFEWKDWEEALKDGDICVITDAVTGQKKAKMKSEMTGGICP